ncbi:hypothetical protein [Cystobacter fuscus]|uniref:hypothetical protein n=1 Tax=Cystobacter fuscus TaxID=43 RepID=UPI002B2A61AD|nr:hypothetical protein F0U63_48560 [Cystobacter fuscus]
MRASWKACRGWMWVAGLCASFEALAFSPWLIPASFPQPGDIYLSGGFLFSGTGRPGGAAIGLGAELSLHAFFKAEPIAGVGIFGQWQSINGEHHRLCAGVQATTLFLGAELGVAHDRAGAEGAATTSLHLQPFLSLGLLSVGLRIGIPVATAPGDKPGYGSDIGLVLSLKLPVPLRKSFDEEG